MESGAVNQTGPYGSLQYQQTGTNPDGTPIYSANTTLSPQQQQLYGQQVQGQQEAGTAADYLGNEVMNNAATGNPALNPTNLGAEFGQQQQAAFGGAMGYLQPQFQQQTGQLNDSLAQQGITQESDPTAYANAEKLLSNNQGQQEQEAYNQSYATGLTGEGQLFGQGVQESNLPISQLESLGSYAAPQGPNFSAYGQNNTYANTAQSAYASNLASYNNNMQGLYGLGGAALTAYGLSGAGSAAAGAGGAAAGGAAAGGAGDAALLALA